MRPVTLRINSRIVDLYGRESLGIDFASFDVDEITKRKGALSINFSVPATANNRQIFDNAQEVTNLSPLPSNILTARLFVDGVDVNITKCELISATDEEFELRLYNDDAGVYLALKERRLGELDLKELDHFQVGSEVGGRVAETAFITYPLLQSSEISFPHNNTDRKFITYAALPCIYLHTLISQMFLSIGYGVVDNITDQLIALPPSDNFRRNKDKRRYLGTASYPGYAVTLGFPINFNTFQNNAGYNVDFFKGSFLDIVGAPLPSDKNSIIEFADDVQDLDITFNFTVETFGAYNSFNVVYEYLDEDGITVVDVLQTTFYEQYTPSIVQYSNQFISAQKFVGQKNNQLRVTIVPDASGILAEFRDPELTINNLKINSGGTVDVLGRIDNPNRWVTANSIPKQDWKWGDLIREYLKLTGGIISFDHVRKIVYLNRLNAIQDNLSDAYIWTNKVDYTEPPKIEFANDQYGQQNNFTYEEPLDSQSEDANGDPLPRFTALDGTNYTQEIANTNLKPEENLIESDFSFSRQLELFQGFDVAHVPQYKYIVPQTPDTFDAPISFERNSVGQPIVLIRQVTDYATPLEVYREFDLYPTGAILTKYTFNVAWFIDEDQALSLGWGINMVDEFYDYLIGIITNYKKVTLRLRLNPVDIRNLNFQRPVYISGTYYYINAVNGYDPVSGESTEVELIKLNPYG